MSSPQKWWSNHITLFFFVLANLKNFLKIGINFSFKDKSVITNTPLEKYNKHIKNILYAISYLNKNGNYKKNLRDFIKDIENLDFNSELIRNAARKYTETAKIETKYIINNTSVFDSNGYKIAVGFGKDLNSTDVCDSIEKKVNSDLIIYAKSDSYSASLRRSKNIDINCIKIAAKMGGGGHPFAAGFPIPVNIDIATNTGRKIFVNKIKKVVDSVLKNDS